jgi:hypothetical protein
MPGAPLIKNHGILRLFKIAGPFDAENPRLRRADILMSAFDPFLPGDVVALARPCAARSVFRLRLNCHSKPKNLA